MEFNENLQKLRKKANLSQEALAEKLGVTRQSVSKWESGASYPEMDKLISMCSIFDCSMDYLLNGKEIIKEENSNKFNVNSIANEIINGVEKTVNMLSKKDGKGILKFILEMIVIIFIILMCKIPIEMLKELGGGVFNNLGTIGDVFQTLWTVFIELTYLILAVLFFVMIFKTRYLDNYEEISNKKIKAEIKDEKNELQKIKETRGGVISFLASILMVFIKFIVGCILIGFAMECMFSIIMFAFSVIIFVQGVYMLGPVIGLFGLMLFSILICELLFNFIVDHRTNMKRVFISFVVSFILIGFGASMTLFAFSKMTYINGVPDRYSKTVETKEIDMNNNLVIPDYCHNYRTVEFIEDNNLENIKIETSSYKNLYNEKIVITENNEIILESNTESINGSEMIKEVIRNLKNKKIYNYDLERPEPLKIYASSKNLEILKNNINNYCQQYTKEVEDSRYQYYEDHISDLTEEKENLLDENQKLRKQKDELEQKNQELKNKITDALNN